MLQFLKQTDPIVESNALGDPSARFWTLKS